MNAQRLAKLVSVVAEDLQERRVVKLLTQLVNHTQEAINSPNETTQRQAESSFNSLAQNLTASATNSLSPGLRADLRELEVKDALVEDLLGERLLDRIRDVLATGYISVAALDKLKAISAEVSALWEAVQALRVNLNAIGVWEETLEEGEAVSGITVPRVAVDNELGRLRKEIAFFDNAIRTLSQCVGDPATPTKVHSLRSSDFGIDLDTSVKVASLLAFIVKGVSAGLDKLKEYRGLKQKAESLGVSAKSVEHLMEEGQSSMDATLASIEAEVIQRCKLDDEGRRNEIENGVRVVVKGVALRLDRGFTFEVRAIAPAEPKPEEEADFAPIAALASMRFEPVSGPPLLALPEAEVEEEPEEEQVKKPKKATGKASSKKTRQIDFDDK